MPVTLHPLYQKLGSIVKDNRRLLSQAGGSVKANHARCAVQRSGRYSKSFRGFVHVSLMNASLDRLHPKFWTHILSHAFSQLGFCELTQYVRYAAYLRLSLANVNMMSGLATDEAAGLVKRVRRCCVVYNTLKR
uniref:Uncharacterized protein n=1 Tax=Caldiarchaeum subterraneum TaxID=311458 RepID=A0A7C5QK95_CALS0